MARVWLAQEKIAPQHIQGQRQGDDRAHGQQGHGQGRTGAGPGLIDVEPVRDGQAGGTVGRIAGGDGDER